MSDRKTPPLPALLLATFVVLTVVACTRPPALDATLSDANRAASFPDLIRGTEILSRGTTEARLDAEEDDVLTTRGDDLRARADALRATEIGQ